MSDPTPGILLIVSLVTLSLVAYVALREFLDTVRHAQVTRHGLFTAFALIVVAIGAVVETWAHYSGQHELDFIGSSLVQGAMLPPAIFLIALHPKLKWYAERREKVDA